LGHDSVQYDSFDIPQFLSEKGSTDPYETVRDVSHVIAWWLRGDVRLQQLVLFKTKFYGFRRFLCRVDQLHIGTDNLLQSFFQ
jgi:hypothetical protein